MAGFPSAATIVPVDPPAAAPNPRAGRRAVTAPTAAPAVTPAVAAAAAATAPAAAAAAAPAAAAAAAPAAAIQIGPDKHHYVYRHCDWSSEVYRCDRCSEWGRHGDRLFLFKVPGPDEPGPQWCRDQESRWPMVYRTSKGDGETYF